MTRGTINNLGAGPHDGIPVNQAAFAETTEFYRTDAALRLDPRRRSVLGQYMTPTPIARFMASLFSDVSGDLRILDPGAGVGSLSAALVERLCEDTPAPSSVVLAAYEIESILTMYLQDTLHGAKLQCEAAHIRSVMEIHKKDFILTSSSVSQADIFSASHHGHGGFTHVIMNPPYKKINSSSDHRYALRKAGIETSNLYTAFMALAAQQLCEGGEMVAIVPRSFCNGPYFKAFRNYFFSTMTLRHIHVFEKRNCAFKGDEVLQENIIVHAIKGQKLDKVTITTSTGGQFEIDNGSRECIGENMTQHTIDHGAVIHPDDPDYFVHITTNVFEQSIVDRMAHFRTPLADLGLSVSTGPVVDFRLKNDLRFEAASGTVPLLYAAHFRNQKLEWPKTMKKPNAIQVTNKSRRWLWENEGHFVVTRRFTSKEERRRIVASIYASDLPGPLVGFENHLNVFHICQKGMSPFLAKGLSIYLNSTLVDRYFRQFNGHTQVNAADLRLLKYPQKETLERWGKSASDAVLSQQEIDDIIEGEIAHMATDMNPFLAQKKIEEALEVLKQLGMPKGQQNERSALTLLALIDLKPEGKWSELQRPLMGITPIMEYVHEHYGREYAPNTRETFRRQTMHQFVEGGLAVYNPDQPDRPVNSPQACYQISEETCQVLLTFDTTDWQSTLDAYLEVKEALAAKWAKHRQMQTIPVHVADGTEISLTPGAHSELIKQIITEFAPRYTPGAEVIYVGDTGSKGGYLLSNRLAELGISVDQHGKLPDVVLYLKEKDWLLLVESVTSHGPVDAKRRNELTVLFANAKPSLIYVTAFPDRTVMGRYLAEISWETEVWCADSPTHLIHFNGERFLGPYEG